MISAVAAVMRVPSTSAHAPNVQCPPDTAQAPPCWTWETSQLLVMKKLRTPMWLKAVED